MIAFLASLEFCKPLFITQTHFPEKFLTFSKLLFESFSLVSELFLRVFWACWEWSMRPGLSFRILMLLNNKSWQRYSLLLCVPFLSYQLWFPPWCWLTCSLFLIHIISKFLFHVWLYPRYLSVVFPQATQIELTSVWNYDLPPGPNLLCVFLVCFLMVT